MTKQVEYPIFLADRSPEGKVFVCIAGPENAVEIKETRDPASETPTGYSFTHLRTEKTVKARMSAGHVVDKKTWFEDTGMLALMYHGSVFDLLSFCESRRSMPSTTNYADVLKLALGEHIVGSRRGMILRKIEAGELQLSNW
ncbi:hypothetical protein ACYPKM_02540 [Pseudomonas aeruginosa]